MASPRQIRGRYQRAKAHVEGWLEIVSVLITRVDGYAGIVIGSLKLVSPSVLPEIMLHPMFLIVAGSLLVGGKGTLEQFDALYKSFKT